jgi:hypothetical protein
MRSLVLVFTTLGVVAGCSSAPPPPPFKPVADVRALMANVVEPASDEYWDAVGYIYDSQGEHLIEPKTVEEWDAVRNHAYVVAESGNLLMMGSRAKDNAEWMQFSQQLIDVGQKAIRAAESRDKNGVFDTGAELYDVCTACHVKYALPIQEAREKQQQTAAR